MDKLGIDHWGICDYLGTWGHVPMMMAADRPLAYGVMLPVIHEVDKSTAHSLVGIIARNRDGLAELYDLVTKAGEQSYYRPRVTWDQLRASDNTAKIGYVVDVGAYDIIQEIGLIAVGPSDVPTRLQKVAIEEGWRMVLAYSPAYPDPQDKKGFDALQQISAMQRAGEALNALPAYPAMLPEEARERMLWLPPLELESALCMQEVLLNDCLISREQFGRAHLPVSPKEWTLDGAVAQGAANRGIKRDDPVYGPRIDRELSVIHDKGFDDYFWFVADAVRYAKDQGVVVGPGRGSAGGSLVAYLLGITEVDPIKHGTLFERFIDPTRSDFPDIDVDFADADRELVFDYLKQKYGEDHVARLGTITWLGGKSAVNDVMRFERHIPFSVGRHIADACADHSLPISISLNNLDETGERYLEEYPELHTAALIDGQARHSGVHAAGVCVSLDPVARYASVSKGTAQLTMGDAEDIGLLKFDALGLTTLSVIQDACIEAGVSYDEIKNLWPDDDRVFEVFRRDDVTGIFQFEGSTVRGLAREVHIDRFSDLCALTSLARPGPLNGGAAGSWVRRRSGDEDWKHDHELLRPILEDTQGLIIYQEQFMKIMSDIADFSVGDVNKARKAVGKKIPEVLAAFQQQFIDGAADSVGRDLAETLWSRIEDFGSYAFNLSHAVAYSLVSYHTALLRAYHPHEFALALLRHSDAERSMHVLRDARRFGLDFVPFDPFTSDMGWSIREGRLVGGFTGQIGIGDKLGRKLLDQRDATDNKEEWFRRTLTPAMRNKLAVDNNPWSNMDEVVRLFGTYFDDPERHNIRGSVYRIQDVPHKKGSYAFIAKIKQINKKDANEPERVKKRGSEITGPTKFLNLIFSDDGIELGATIYIQDYVEYGWRLVEDEAGNDISKDTIGTYWLVRGDITGNGPRWIMCNKMKRLHHVAYDEALKESQDDQ